MEENAIACAIDRINETLKRQTVLLEEQVELSRRFLAHREQDSAESDERMKLHRQIAAVEVRRECALREEAFANEAKNALNDAAEKLETALGKMSEALR